MALEDEVVIVKQTLADLIVKVDMLCRENYDIRDELPIKSLLKLRDKLKLARLECNNVLLCSSKSNY